MPFRLYAYDVFMTLGASLVTGGAAVAWGMAGGLIAGGVCMLGLTYLGARR